MALVGIGLGKPFKNQLLHTEMIMIGKEKGKGKGKKGQRESCTREG